MTTDYGQDTGSLIMASLITRGIFAINDVDARYNPMDLTLGANGGINMVVGNNFSPDMPDKCLTIIDNFKNVPGTYNIQAIGSNAIALSPADHNSTVYIGDAIIYSDTDNVYLSTFDKGLSLDVDALTIGGSLLVKNDLKVEGELFTGEVNITHQMVNSNVLGYAFRVNAANSNLELIKYLHNHENTSNSVSQLVAAFGKGPLYNDPNYSYNTFEYAGDSSSGSGSGGSNSPQVSTDTYWSANGNDIFFGEDGGTQQRVGINTNAPQHPLDVVGTIQADKFIIGPATRSFDFSQYTGDGSTSRAFGDANTITIENGGIDGLTTIAVDSVGPTAGIFFKNIIADGVGGYWNGHASNLHNIDKIHLSTFSNDMNVSDFYTGTSTVWFDNEASNILLSSFSNDVFTPFDPVFSNCTVTELLSASNANLVNMTCETTATFTGSLDVQTIEVATDATVGGSLSVAGQTIMNTLSVAAIDTSSVTANNLTTKNTLETSNLNVTGQLDASSITALVNQLVADQLETRLATITGTLSVAELVTSTVSSHFIPNGNEVFDLGTPENKWRDLYLSGNTLHVDDYAFQVEQDTNTGSKSLKIRGGDVQVGNLRFNQDLGVLFGDGTSISSMNEIASSVTEGDIFGDFTSYTVRVASRGGNSFVEQLSGVFVYPSSHNIVESGNRWRVVEFPDHVIPPMLANGSGIDKSGVSMKSIKYGGNPKDIQLSFLKGNRVIGNNIFLTSDNNTNINHMFPLRILDPYSKNFRHKCKADFHYYKNVLEGNAGNHVYHHSVYFGKGDDETSQFVRLNSMDAFNARSAGNKLYDIELIYYFNAPLYDTRYIIDNMNSHYLIPQSPADRLNKAYELTENTDLGIETYQLVEVNPDYGLYPRISIQKWDNSVNLTEFSEVLYDTSMNWGEDTPSLSVVFQRFKECGWLEELFKITYNYLIYGVVEGEIEEIPQNVLSEFNRLDETSLVFISGSSVVIDENTTIDNNTTVCFKKSVFEDYVAAAMAQQ